MQRTASLELDSGAKDARRRHPAVGQHVAVTAGEHAVMVYPHDSMQDISVVILREKDYIAALILRFALKQHLISPIAERRRHAAADDGN